MPLLRDAPVFNMNRMQGTSLRSTAATSAAAGLPTLPTGALQPTATGYTTQSFAGVCCFDAFHAARLSRTCLEFSLFVLVENSVGDQAHLWSASTKITFVSSCIYTHTPTDIHKYIHTHVHTRIRTCIHVCMQHYKFTDMD